MTLPSLALVAVFVGGEPPLADKADTIDPAAVQALPALWDDDFLPLAMGTAVFMFASGPSTVRHAALPKWLGWAAILFADLAHTDRLGRLHRGAVWILVVSVPLALNLRGLNASTPTRPAA